MWKLKSPKAATCGHSLGAATCGHLQPLEWLQVKWLQVAVNDASDAALRPLAATCPSGHLRPLEWLQVAASGCEWLRVAASGCEGLRVAASTASGCE